jgi:hypothetical protein
MRIFFCGGVDTKFDKKYLEGIEEVARGLIARGHSAIHIGTQSGPLGLIYKTYKANGGQTTLLAPDCYEDEAEGLPCHEKIRVTTLYQLQQIALKNSDLTIILPGGNGTLAELYMMTDNIKAGFDADPIVLFNINGFYDKIKEMNKFLIGAGAMRSYQEKFFTFLDTPTQVLDYVDKLAKKQTSTKSKK